MKKKLILAACVAFLASACQPKANSDSDSDNSSEGQNYQGQQNNMKNMQPQQQKSQQTGCSETGEAPTSQPAPQQQTQTVATPEVKLEAKAEKPK